MIAGQQNVPDSLPLQEPLESIVSVWIVHYDILRIDFYGLGHRDGKIPETGIVVLRSGIEPWKLAEVVNHWLFRRDSQALRQGSSLVRETV